MPKITGSHTQGQVMTGSNRTWMLASNASVLSSDGSMPSALMDTPDSEGNRINISGSVKTEISYTFLPNALLIYGSEVTLTIGKTGMLQSMNGLMLLGSGGSIDNAGAIAGGESGGHGVLFSHVSDTDFRNSGTITGSAGLGAYDSWDNRIINEQSGEIVGVVVGLYTNAATGAAIRVINHGLISGDTALHFNGGEANVTNRGILDGVVVFGNGDDRLDTRRGTVTDNIFGGDGSDTLIVDNASMQLVELSIHTGLDTIKSTVSYRLTSDVEQLILLGSRNIKATGTVESDVLHGNRGRNVISGLDGIDHLYGHKGKDWLSGGFGVDVFHFSTGDGHDTISELHQDGRGFVEIMHWNGINSFAQLKRHSREVGDDLLIEAGGDSIRINGESLASLLPGDFIF